MLAPFDEQRRMGSATTRVMCHPAVLPRCRNRWNGMLVPSPGTASHDSSGTCVRAPCVSPFPPALADRGRAAGRAFSAADPRAVLCLATGMCSTTHSGRPSRTPESKVPGPKERSRADGTMVRKMRPAEPLGPASRTAGLLKLVNCPWPCKSPHWWPGEVATGGQVKVPTLCSPCRTGA
jgi:hypothetical protein